LRTLTDVEGELKSTKKSDSGVAFQELRMHPEMRKFVDQLSTTLLRRRR
jgi:hypothetical protein